MLSISLFKNKKINLYKLHKIFLIFIVLTTGAQGSCIYCDDPNRVNNHNDKDSELKDSELVTTACGHIYHLPCITKYLDDGRTSEDSITLMRNCIKCQKLTVPLVRDHHIDLTNAPPYCETEEMNACRLGNIDKLTDILTNNPEIVHKTLDQIQNISLLHIAAKHGNYDCLQTLLKFGGNSNIELTNGTTPLHMAVSSQNLGCIEALINASANLNAFTHFNYITPIYLAVQTGYEDGINLLTKHKEKINNNPWPKDSTLLYHACMNGHIKVVKYMLEAKVDPNHNMLSSPHNTPMQASIKHQHSDCVKTLIIHKAKINFKDLHTARMTENTEILNILLEAWVDIKNSSQGYKIIGDTIQMRNTDMLRILIDPNVTDVNTPFDNGETILHLVVSLHYIDGLKILIDAGANVNATTNTGETCLIIANKYEDIESIKLLKDAGAKF